MRLFHVRLDKEVAVNNARTFMARERVLAEEAFAGDILGLPNHGTIRVGDTFTEGEPLKFTGIPSFAPELFRRVLLLDPLKSKALNKGLTHLCEEGAATLFRPLQGAEYIIGAVGPLQFDVIKSRLVDEYNVRAQFEQVSLRLARWIRSDDPKALDRFVDRNMHRVFRDLAGNLTFVCEGPWAIDYAVQNNPEIRFLETIEIQ